MLSSGARMQPSARGRLRAAGPCGTDCVSKHSDRNYGCGLLRFLTEPQIQYSKLNESAGYVWIYIPVRVAACGGTPATLWSCGPPLPGGCGPPMPAASNPAISPQLSGGRHCRKAVPQPSGGACDVKEQPSARGRLWAAAPYGRNFRITGHCVTEFARSIITLIDSCRFARTKSIPQGSAGRSFAPRRPAVRVPQVRSCVHFASRGPKTPNNCN